ncbi:hypothetical protein VPHD518_0008 [Vibrio phage D518]
MIKRIPTPKRVFTYTLGSDPRVYSVEDLPSHPEMQVMYDNWLIREKDYERDWRNYELTNTDWMLVGDATYGGELLAGSSHLDDIVEYRSQLRAYNLTTDTRPERPEWFKDKEPSYDDTSTGSFERPAEPTVQGSSGESHSSGV